jgi:hypothetical protein
MLGQVMTYCEMLIQVMPGKRGYLMLGTFGPG